MIGRSPVNGVRPNVVIPAIGAAPIVATTLISTQGRIFLSASRARGSARFRAVDTPCRARMVGGVDTLPGSPPRGFTGAGQLRVGMELDIAAHFG